MQLILDIHIKLISACDIFLNLSSNLNHSSVIFGALEVWFLLINCLRQYKGTLKDHYLSIHSMFCSVKWIDLEYRFIQVSRLFSINALFSAAAYWSHVHDTSLVNTILTKIQVNMTLVTLYKVPDASILWVTFKFSKFWWCWRYQLNYYIYAYRLPSDIARPSYCSGCQPENHQLEQWLRVRDQSADLPNRSQ